MGGVGGLRGSPLTSQAVGTDGAALAQHRQHHVLTEEQLPDHPVTPPAAPRAPRAPTQLEALKDHGVPGWGGHRRWGHGGSVRRQGPGSPPRAPPGAHRCSRISGSVMRVLVMCVWTPLRPCQRGPAPAPPATVS